MTSRPTPQFAAETKADGSFVRQVSRFQDLIADGAPVHQPAANRYHLYVSYACPWAHRAILTRKLKGLESAIGMTIVDPVRDERGWRLTDEYSAMCDEDPEGFDFLSEAYLLCDPNYKGRVTTPTLWDKKTRTVVSNESSSIVRMLNAQFNSWATYAERDLCPAELAQEIDDENERIYHSVNNGVYRCGFAVTQSAYDEAFDILFNELARLEHKLSTSRWLVGNRFTECDLRLFVTLIRFDAVYVGHFKCNLHRIADMENLSGYLRDIYAIDGVAETVNIDHIKRHYYMTHPAINPTRIVPKGPALDFDSPHHRESLGPAAFSTP